MNNLVVNDNGEVKLASSVKNTIFEIEREIKYLTDLKEKYKKALIKEVETRGFDKCTISNELFTLSYKAPSTRESLDTKRLRAEMPDVYDEYVKISDIASSISIKLKDENYEL